jgi:hypothetical protein
VRGHEHYDRQGLIEHLLTAQDTAIWVVGARRMGKTSLLRQIEFLTDQASSRLAPLYWDLQGCTTPADLTLDLLLAIEDAAARFAGLEVELDALRQEDAVAMLRRLSRILVRQERQLLLLVDEAEVLVEIAQTDPSWLARLRKAMQEGHLRTIIASTRLLTQLTDQSAGWITSPFLFGFRMVTLWPLQREGAANLVRQSQAEAPVAVDDAILDAVLHATNHHPYLIQYLCERLCVTDERGSCTLRPLEEDDLAVDHILAGFFMLDFQRMNAVERRILLTVMDAGAARPDELAAVAGPVHQSRLPHLLQSLKELGHLRQVENGWVVGSEFLRRWLGVQREELLRELEQTVPGDAPPLAEITRLDETNVEVVARSLGVSAERVRALANTQIRSEAEFYAVVCSFFFEIRHLVEQDEGHRLLVTHQPDGAIGLRSEEEIQIALKHWLRPMCRALNIDMDREPLNGRGLLDFKFSIGHDFRCLVEVKLFTSSKLQDGLGIQLPIYLLADKSTYGIYVPIFLQSAGYEQQVRDLRALAQERAHTHGVQIEVIDIRAWRPTSASKAEMPDAPDRYQLDPRPSEMAARLQTRRPDDQATHNELAAPEENRS